MLPRPRQEMSAEETSIYCTPPYARRGPAATTCRLVHWNYLIAHIVHHDVVLRSKRIMIPRRERLRVGFNQPLVWLLEVFERRSDRVGIGRACLLDRKREKAHGIIGIRGSDRCDDVLRPLDLRIFLFERLEHLLADCSLRIKEAVGLDEMRLAGCRSRQLRETPARNAP